MSLSADDELPHPGLVDEWVFAAWTADASIGIVSGHRLTGATGWYWTALVERGQPLLHLTEWDLIVRADPFIVKAPAMWAEHQCDAPMEQWSIGNEGFFVALDRPAEALDRAYGSPTPVSFDLEWYATGEAEQIVGGYQQRGVVHGTIELLHRANLEFEEIRAHRWRRWGAALDPLRLPAATSSAATDAKLRAPFAFPDGTIGDWVLTPDGWRCPSPT